jgi:hypothetical protein
MSKNNTSTWVYLKQPKRERKPIVVYAYGPAPTNERNPHRKVDSVTLHPGLNLVANKGEQLLAMLADHEDCKVIDAKAPIDRVSAAIRDTVVESTLDAYVAHDVRPEVVMAANARREAIKGKPAEMLIALGV